MDAQLHLPTSIMDGSNSQLLTLTNHYPPCTPTKYFKSLTQQFCSTLPLWQRPLFGPIYQLQPTNWLYHLSATAQPITIVSNALLQKDHHSRFAWVITNNNRVGLAPGNAEVMHSGQAEAFGVLAALLFLHHYIQSFGPHLFPETTIKGYCNNSGVVTTITDISNSTITHPNDTMNNNRDVYLAIQEAILECTPITLQFFHVKGHQDSKSNKLLTVIEQFNVECDCHAKQFVRTLTQASTSFNNPEIPAARPHLWIDGKSYVGNSFLPSAKQCLCPHITSIYGRNLNGHPTFWTQSTGLSYNAQWKNSILTINGTLSCSSMTSYHSEPLKLTRTVDHLCAHRANESKKDQDTFLCANTLRGRLYSPT